MGVAWWQRAENFAWLSARVGGQAEAIDAISFDKYAVASDQHLRQLQGLLRGQAGFQFNVACPD